MSIKIIWFFFGLKEKKINARGILIRERELRIGNYLESIGIVPPDIEPRMYKKNPLRIFYSDSIFLTIRNTETDIRYILP